jgi:hypothetical protein
MDPSVAGTAEPEADPGPGGADMSDDKAKPAEVPVPVYPHSRVRDDMDDETWQYPRPGRAGAEIG